MFCGHYCGYQGNVFVVIRVVKKLQFLVVLSVVKKGQV